VTAAIRTVRFHSYGEPGDVLRLEQVPVPIYDRSRPTFEPALTVGVLARCRVDANTPAGTVLKTKAGRFKRIFRAIDAHRGGAGKPLLTAVTAQIVGPSKNKNSKLTFDAPTPMRAYPLFEITADNIRNVVAAVRSDWVVAIGEQLPQTK
jgi:hypothetical protein